MVALALAIAAFIVGPLLHRLARTSRSALAALDSFAFVAITGLLLIHIIPDSLSEGGWLAAAGALVGIVGPVLAERSLARAARQVHVLFLAVAMLGLGAHDFLDGLAIAEAQNPSGPGMMLAVAVIIHRLPVGLTIWWLLRQPYGIGVAAGTLCYLSVATVIGFFVGEAWLAGAAQHWFAVVQALVAGSLVHVVLHHPQIAPASAEERRALVRPAVLGGLLAVTLLVVLFFTVAKTEPGPPLPLVLLGGAAFLVALLMRFAPHKLLGRFTSEHEEHDHHHH